MLPSEVPRLATDLPVRVFPGVWKPLFFKTPFLGRISIPTSFVSLFIFYIFSYLLSKTMGCFSGCLMSAASIQKLFYGICSGFKCSFDEFVGEKVVSPSYSSTILGLPPWKDPDAGKDWRQEEKGTTEDEMIGWHHQLNGHGFGWTLVVGDGQGCLVCCGSWGRKELDTTEPLSWTGTSQKIFFSILIKRYIS